MKPIALAALAASGIAAACGPVQQDPEFKTQQEKACYQSASASLPAGRELRRGPDGNFVEVTVVNDFMRDVERSAAFDGCMASVRPAGSTGDMGTITFSAEEQVIWNSLTDDARAKALEYIRNGGTLREFVAQG